MWNFNRYSSIFIQENAFENGVCEMASISSRPQCVDIENRDQPFRNLANSFWPLKRYISIAFLHFEDIMTRNEHSIEQAEAL